MFGMSYHGPDSDTDGHKPPPGNAKLKSFLYPMNIRDAVRAEWQPLFEKDRLFMQGKGEPLTDAEERMCELYEEILGAQI